MTNKYLTTPAYLLVLVLCLAPLPGQTPVARSAPGKGMLRAEQDEQTGAITVYRDGGKVPILTQSALRDERPYLHPIVAPDGKSLLTEYRPSHHPHQTGIFWGFKFVNGREFFMHWQGDYYRRVSANVIQRKGEQVKWQTVYDLLDEKGNVVMTETQNWSMQEPGGKYVFDLEWKGEAKTDIAFGKTYVGGLFVRMPWHEGSRAEVVNAAGQRNHEAEGQHAIWTDLGIQVDGRDDLAHIVIFDHPDNRGFPAQWRVDSQFGLGTDKSWIEWKLDKGQTDGVRYRLIAYTGDLNPVEITREWKEFVKEF
jgi:Methane oxygenase PmoA